jgi:hypothetical protein
MSLYSRPGPMARRGPRADVCSAIVLLFLVLALPSLACATIWHVPTDPGAATIAEALGNAQSFDTVRIAPGIYHEHDLVVPHGVTVEGDTTDPAAVVIDAQGQGRVMAVLDPDAFNLSIRRLTLTGGDADRGGGLYTVGANVYLSDLRLVDNTAAYGGGIFADGVLTDLTACVVAGNHSHTFGGGVYVIGDHHQLVLTQCAVVRNVAAGAAGAWYAAAGAELAIAGSTVAENTAGLQGIEGGAFAAGWVYQHSNVRDNVLPVNLPARGAGRDPAPSADWLVLVDIESEPDFTCTVSGNGWPGVLADQEGTAGNVTADPLFCHLGNPVGEPERYFGVAADSPCLPENSPGGCTTLIGAFGQACDVPVGVPPSVAARACALDPPAPNPFNPATTLRFEIRDGGRVRLAVFDMAGRLIATVVDGYLPAGRHEAVWRGLDDSGRRVASGMYLGRLTADGTSACRRLTLVK